MFNWLSKQLLLLIILHDCLPAFRTGFAESLPGGEFCETLETPDSLPRSLGTLGTTCQAKNRHPPAKFFCLRVEYENRDMTFRFQIEGLAW